MAHRFAEIAFTERVRAEQEREGSRESYARLEIGEPHHDRLGPAEAAFLSARDSFYLATVSETGWPYVQHRGGPPGFLRVLGPRTLAFADYEGNHQLVSTGNLAGDGRVALFLMDYANRRRMKILGRARVVDARQQPDRVAALLVEAGARVERIGEIEVLSFDWNCPQHITPRFTAEEVACVVEPLQREIAQLQAQLAGASPRPSDRRDDPA